MNLLVVDDDPVIRMMMRTILTSEGFRVETAADGNEALTKLVERHFDLVICDVYMPGIDGIQLRKIVRALPRLAHIPFLFISGHHDVSATEVARDPAREGFQYKGQPFPALLSWIQYLTAHASQKSQRKLGRVRKSGIHRLRHHNNDSTEHRALLM
jgi:CheY-like chemotaxis protein